MEKEQVKYENFEHVMGGVYDPMDAFGVAKLDAMSWMEIQDCIDDAILLFGQINGVQPQTSINLNVEKEGSKVFIQIVREGDTDLFTVSVDVTHDYFTRKFEGVKL
jgi:hypothetical protein